MAAHGAAPQTRVTHFEKVMQFAMAWQQWHKPEYLQASGAAFYTSQDADLIDGQHSAAYFKLNDAARRRLGVPRVDRHV